MNDYTLISRELIEHAKIPKEDIFEYDLSPLKELYEMYFQFCQTNLTYHCTEHNIQPAKFYFRTSYGCNASAGIKNDYFIIRVNMQTIQELYDLFYSKNQIFTDDEYLPTRYRHLISIVNEPIGYLMFQISTLNTYYHELGHLIQKSFNRNEDFIEEFAIEQINFDIGRHVLELDADLNSTFFACSHILEYFKKLPHEEQTNYNFTTLLSIGISSILSYFLINTNKNILYYKELTHPHPIIRITYIIDQLVKTAELNLPKHLVIDSDLIIKESIMISDLLFKSVRDSNIVEQFIETYLNEHEQIRSYIKELFIISYDMPELILNRNK